MEELFHRHVLAYQYLHSAPYLRSVRGYEQYFVALMTELLLVVDKCFLHYIICKVGLPKGAFF